MRVGLDFGGVIVQSGEGDTVFEPEAGKALVYAIAIASVREIVARTDGRVWIVSKASRGRQAATRNWMAKVNFYQRTGFAAANLVFCEKRRDKVAISRELRLTHFADDSLEVVDSLVGYVPHIYLFGKQAASSRYLSVADWDDLLRGLFEGHGQ